MEEDQLEAIDTSSGDESAGLATSAPQQQAAPAIDTSDAPAPAASGQEAPATGPDGPIARNLRAFPANVKRIASYLMGEGAADPQQLTQVGASVDPEGQLSPSDRNILAIQKVAESEGPEAAWKLAQANRVSYNAKQAFAYSALNGTPQKPANLNAAIDAANQAAEHVLDGSDVHFMASKAGQVTATVKGRDGQPQVIDVPIEAFRQYLNVGRTGQYDRVMQDTVPGTLQKLVQQAAGASRVDQLRPLPKSAPARAATEDAGEALPTAPTPKTNFGKTPSTMNLSGSEEVQQLPPRVPTEDADLEERGNRMFPSVSQSGEREAWMNSELQRQEGNQNKIDVAGETGKRREEVARITGQSRVQGENIKADASKANAQTKAVGYAARDERKAKIEAAKIDQRMREMQARGQNATQHEQMASVRAKVLSMQPLSPEETAVYTRVMGKPPGDEPQAPQRQVPAQQQAPAPQKQGSAQQPPVQGAKLYKGTWYTRGPNGESVPYQP